MTFDGFDAQILIEPTMMWDPIQPEEGGGGGSGEPSAHELDIFNAIQPWDPFVWGDDSSSMTQSGMLYVDRDANGWFDYAEFTDINGTVWEWKDESGWKPKDTQGD